MESRSGRLQVWFEFKGQGCGIVANQIAAKVTGDVIAVSWETTEESDQKKIKSSLRGNRRGNLRVTWLEGQRVRLGDLQLVWYCEVLEPLQWCVVREVHHVRAAVLHFQDHRVLWETNRHALTRRSTRIWFWGRSCKKKKIYIYNSDTHLVRVLHTQIQLAVVEVGIGGNGDAVLVGDEVAPVEQRQQVTQCGRGRTAESADWRNSGVDRKDRKKKKKESSKCTVRPAGVTTWCLGATW